MVYVEACRTQPRRIFFIGPDGSARCQQDDGYIPRAQAGWDVKTRATKDGWTATLKLPWEWLGSGAIHRARSGKPKPFRVNVIRQLAITSAPGGAECSWAQRNPGKGRLVWGDLNPATDFGWLAFE